MQFRDLALYFEKEKVLVISDIHLGFEESLNKNGFMIPRTQFKDTIERLKKILDGIEVEVIVINGDLKHEFGNISQTEWKDILGLWDFLSEHCKNIVLVKGNHDPILGPIADKRNLSVLEYCKFGDVLVCHGDSIIDVDAKLVVIGHDHPAISLKRDDRVEKYKCFLIGDGIVVMPSFNLVVDGGDVLKGKLMSPYLKNIEDFEVKVVGDRIYNFGKVKHIRKKNED